ncbi:MAG: hypothetical protein ACJ74O_13775 [Frankiaceae bacterium]
MARHEHFGTCTTNAGCFAGLAAAISDKIICSRLAHKMFWMGPDAAGQRGM